MTESHSGWPASAARLTRGYGGEGIRGARSLLVVAAVLVVVAATGLSLPSITRAAVVTYAGNNARLGLYSTSRLAPALVASKRFGRLFDRTLPDGGQVFGQPLVAGGRLILATEKNDVYELDPRTGRILRSRFLIAPWHPTFLTSTGKFTCHDLYPSVGVTSTPVIDTSAAGGQGVIYLTAKTPLPAALATGFNQGQYLMYALRLSDLSNVPSFNGGQPVALNGLIPSDAPLFAFNATYQLQRPGLLDSGGWIYAGFSGLCDTSPYAGWVIGVQASDGAAINGWASPTATGARGGGIWMSGAGLMSDRAGRIFFSSGNGFNAPGPNSQHTPSTPTPGTSPPSGLASSVVQLQAGAGGSLRAADFFTPCRAARLDGNPNHDLDLSSGGVVALPRSFGGSSRGSLLLAGGKSAALYLLYRNALGGFKQGPRERDCRGGGDAAAAKLASGAIWGETAVWSGDGGWLVVPTTSPKASNDPREGRLEFYSGHLGSFRLAGTTSQVWGKGSGSPIITAIGGRGSSALVWDVSANGRGRPGLSRATLRVYGVVIPRGKRAPVPVASFPVGIFTKFAPPGVGANAIFVGGAGHVVGFGIR